MYESNGGFVGAGDGLESRIENETLLIRDRTVSNEAWILSDTFEEVER
ncbi:MAG: hypothetical protein ABEK59_04055 [Halobacteria archaeon]